MATSLLYKKRYILKQVVEKVVFPGGSKAQGGGAF
jgi:hypothetical protein